MSQENILETSPPEKNAEIGLIKERAKTIAKELSEELSKEDSFIHADKILKERVEFIANSLTKIYEIFEKDSDTLKKVSPYSNLSHELGNVLGDLSQINFKWMRKVKSEGIGTADRLEKYTEIVERFNFKTKQFYDYLYDLMQVPEYFDNEISSKEHYKKAA